MKAALFHEFGPPSVLQWEDVADPAPKPGHVVVKILATGVNRLEHYLREGSVVQMPLPHVLGSDAVGVVAAVGAGVEGFAEGDRVMPMPGYPQDPADAVLPISAAPSYAIGGIVQWGAYAQYLQVPAQWLLHDTTGLAPELAATLPMVAVTGVRAVMKVGGVKAGDRVLVHAASSGTGSFNVQLAKALGAEVATTVDTPDKVEFARGLGADLVIDITRQDFVEAARDWSGGGVDVVIDNLGGPVLAKSLAAARVGGTVVAMGFVAGVEVGFHVRDFFFSHKRLLGTLMGDVEDLQAGLALVGDGRIRPQLGMTLPMSEAAEAHRLISSNAVNGNIVMRAWD